MAEHVPLNENVWFKRHQRMLLDMVNTNFGRDLFCIDKTLPRIIGIRKNCVKAYLGTWNGRDHFIYDFRVGTKYGNGIRERWEQFQSFSRYFLNKDYGVPISPLVCYSRSLVATTTTVYPDPDPETTSCDGQVKRNVNSETWATIRAGAGVTANTTNTEITPGYLQPNAATDTWDQMLRAVFGFDTSAISDTETIDSGTLTLTGSSGKTDNFAQSIVIDRNPPATATDLVTGDFDVGGWDGVEQSTARISITNWSTTGANDFTLSASGKTNVSKTGITWYGCRLSGDFDNSAPTWAGVGEAYTQCKAAETALTTSDPKLVVISSAPATGFINLPLLGVG